MNIVMLGHSDAGKTTYMSLMYDRLNKGVGGFRVAAAHDEDHRRLRRAARAIREGRYPDGSDRRQEHALRLRYGDSPLIDFVWKDYRGGALTERASEAQAAELFADLRKADGIVLFVDAHDLVSNPRGARKVRRLSVLVADALQDRQALTPVVIAFTKCDLLPAHVADDELCAPFQTLIEAVGKQEHICGTTTRVICGRRSAHVDVPVLFCLSIGIVATAYRLRNQAEAHARERDAALARDNWWDRFSKSFQGVPSHRQHAVSLHQEVVRESAALNALIEPGQRLMNRMLELPQF